MADLDTIASELSTIGSHLGTIKDLLAASQQASAALREQAEAVLAAHEQSAQQYMAQLPEEPSPETFPFESLPAGTENRELPAGRMFELSDGSLLRWSNDEKLVFVGADGLAQPITITGRELVLPNQMLCTLKIEQLHVTHEAAGIAGLPITVEPTLVTDSCYAADLPGGMRLIVNHIERSAVLINATGTILVLSRRKAEGIGEKIEVKPISTSGDWAFVSLVSDHRGVLRGDGNIELVLSGGLDLTITFPAEPPDGDEDPSPAPCDICGLEHM